MMYKGGCFSGTWVKWYNNLDPIDRIGAEKTVESDTAPLALPPSLRIDCSGLAA
jgi:hypothetical protein